MSEVHSGTGRTPLPALPVLMDRALGAYLGFAIGDALGATVEFMTPREISHLFAAQGGVHREIVGGGWLKLPPGQVTDDTTMSLALGDALLRGARLARPFDTRLIADAFVVWWRGRPVDCGHTCRRGIQRYLAHGTLHGEPQAGDAGNGALMRNLPVALATLGDDASFERVSIAQARITHHHPLSDAAVLGIGRLLRALLAGAEPSAVAAQCEDLVEREPAFRFRPYPARASAYVVDTAQTVLHHLLAFDDFEAALVATVNRGEDADTTGALVGMLAGARCGAAALPRRWRRRLAPAVLRAVTDQASALVALAHARAESSERPLSTCEERPDAMPIHDYRCTACQADFELLVRSSTVPACPRCGSTVLDRLVSLTAPQGSSKALISAGRQAAAKEGHFSHYSRAERAKAGG